MLTRQHGVKLLIMKQISLVIESLMTILGLLHFGRNWDSDGTRSSQPIKIEASDASLKDIGIYLDLSVSLSL